MRKKSRRPLCAFVADLLESRQLLSTTYFVDANAPGNTQNGLSWETAFKDLQKALVGKAIAGDTVKVADGTYKPTMSTDRTVSFNLINGVGVYGGFEGYGATDPDARDATLYPTLLSGDIGAVGTNTDNVYHVVSASGVNSSTVLDGVTITLGYSNGTGTNQRAGGGMLNLNSSPTLFNCKFVLNGVSNTFDYIYGGGMYNSASSPSLINCAFISNNAYRGGGIYNDSSSSPKLTNCIFTRNACAVYNTSSSPVLTNCILWSNGSSPIQNQSSSTPIVTYSDIEGGYAGTGNINADPCFVRSPWTGPDGVWGTADDDYGDLRLRSSSPCINAGLNSANTSPTDLAGNPRIQDGVIDIGAYEGAVTDPAPKTLYVDFSAIGNNSGSSWDNAFASLQSAIFSATDGDVIKIADGTYKPTTTTDRNISFALRNNVTIFGGYAGYGTADPDARDVDANPTILSGDIGVVGTNTDNSNHVISATSLSSVSLDGMTITLGYTAAYGGGMTIQTSSVTLNNCKFIGNTGGNGGGIYSDYSSLTLNNCPFTGNVASYGGGIYASSSPSIMTGCSFNGNSASNGGGAYLFVSTLTMTDCAFTGNTATNTAGGLYNNYPANITNCKFIANTAASGGGMYNSSASPTLTNCLFAGNSASTEGSGFYNTSSSSGSYTQTLINCVFSGNTAPSYGYVIYSKSSSSKTKLTNCIAWNNGLSPIYSYGSISISYSDVEGGFSGTGNINSDPLFVRSSWPGPDGVFGTADDDTGDLRLRPGSPCLNAGLNSANVLPVDLAGNARIQGSAIDMGVYEGDFAAADPKTLYVDLNATGENNGSSWTSAYTSLQPALAAAADGDVIKVADGTYKPTTTADRTISFFLRNRVSIFGGYAGYGASDPDARDYLAYPTLLSGDIGTVGSNADNSYHVVFSSSVYGSTTLDGAAIAFGNANGTGNFKNFGGGMFINFSSLILSNCSFAGNTSSNTGGGIFTYSSTTLVNCSFVSNTSQMGGGMYNGSASILTNCTFTGNVAPSGGGIYNSSNSLILTNSILWNNGASAIYNGSSTPVITYCDIEGGYAGTGNINADPCFVRSPWSGMDGVWGTADDDYGDFRLGSSSPCINAGLNSANTLPADLAGNPRVQDDVIDLGAYEGAVTVPAPKTLYVDLNATGDNTGTSWDNAFASLQSAIIAASNGDVIKVADGTYKPTTTSDRTASFSLKNAVSIIGGYAGYGAANPESRDPADYPTILSGDIGVNNSNNDNSYHVVLANSVNATAILDGVVIAYGNANGSGTNQNGGGMLNTASSPTLINCKFSWNNSSQQGGGMYNSCSSPTLYNCTFIQNSAGYGGGIYNAYVSGLTSSPTLTNCTFTANTVSADGGGIYNYSSYSKLINCVFIRNKASITGGGIYNTVSSPNLVNCTLAANVATTGGGLSNYSSSPNLTNCILWGNGVSIYNSSSTPNVAYCDIEGGYAGTGNINADPCFVSMPWIGPDGVWGTSDDACDLQLRSISPCLDVGLNSANASQTDRVGYPRIQNAVIDLGAYEGAAQIEPKTLYVDQNATGSMAGDSWTNAFTDLQSAILAATDGDTIRIADGTYKPTTTTDQNYTFALKNGVLIYGGYAGCGAANPDDRNASLYPTLLSGNIGRIGIQSDNSYHVVTAVSVSSSTLLDGVVITLGYASGSGAAQLAGGMLLDSASPTLNNCSFLANFASSSGGALYIKSASAPVLTNCAFIGNSVFSFGGAVYITSSTPTFVNCTFVANTAPTGMALYNLSSTPKLTNCILWNNGATPVSSSSSTPIITYCDIEGGYTGTENINVNPSFIRNPSFGSDAAWGTADDDYGNLHLQFASPCLNKGLNSANTTTMDLAGNPRIQSFVIDLGAYEGISDVVKVFYVDPNATGSNTGASWANAFVNLQLALNSAVSGNIIAIADGVYKPTLTTDRTLSFNLKSGIAVYGGYAGFGASNPDAREPKLYPTVLSGDIGTIGSNNDNSYHVVAATNVDSSTILDGLTIAVGNANGSGTNQSNGGGLFLESASPTIVNCSFLTNYSSLNSGAIYIKSASAPVVINCVFTRNYASNGGVVHCASTAVSTFVNCTFYGNNPSTGTVFYNTTSSPKITNCILWNNGSSSIKNVNGSSPTVTYSDIEGSYTGTGNLNANPLLCGVPWPGPDGVWGTTDDVYGNLKLQSGSPCLNKGLNSANTTPTDLAGNARIQNTTIDMGAYEGYYIPTTYYVDPNAAGDNSGKSWVNAFTNLQAGLAAAFSGDTLKVADGTYKPTTTTDRNITFNLSSGVALYGGYAGFGAANPEARDVSLYPPILSGDIGNAGMITDNSYHVVTASGVNSSAILDGFTITLGNANGTGTDQNNGGGMLNLSAASPKLTNCSFIRNSASALGGGMYNNASSPTLTFCMFYGNNSSKSGGGMYNFASSPNLSNSVFVGNAATVTGGGMYNAGASASPSSTIMTNCTLAENTAPNAGGIYIDSDYAATTLTNCILWNNSNPAIYYKYSAPPITYTETQSMFAGTGNIHADPLFARNPSAGVDRRWGTNDDDYGDLRLQIASPCIDKGLNSANTASTDLAGNPRVINSTIDFGAYETTLPIALAGSSSNDFYVAKLSADGATLQIWTSPDTSTAPAYVYAIKSFSAVALDLGAGSDTLLLDLSNGADIPLTLSNIEKVQILSTSATSLGLSTTGINTATAFIPFTGTPTFQLDSNILKSLSLTGNISLNLTKPNLIVSYGVIPSLRTYLANAATGAKPSIVCDSASTLALIDNSKLHKTSFAGVTLFEPFSQVLIQPAAPGDANLDGVVNENDLLVIFANLNKTNATWLNGDVDQSGTVDLTDLALVQSKLVSPALPARSTQKSPKKSPVIHLKPVMKHKIQKKHR